jgi:hypothetical protein
MNAIAPILIAPVFVIAMMSVELLPLALVAAVVTAIAVEDLRIALRAGLAVYVAEVAALSMWLAGH